VLASVAASAVIGCYVVIAGEFEDTEARLLATSLSVFAASTVTLVCGAAWERARLGVVPALGIALAVISLVLALVLIWGGADAGDEWYWKVLSTISTPAVAAAHASFVAMFVLRGRFRLAPLAPYLMNTVVVTLALLATWWTDVADSEPLLRLYGTAFVLLIATTIALPILRRLEGRREDEERSPAPARFCPNCGERLDPAGATACPDCGAGFQVELALP
jgi:hypothetical protein